jgi:hypothetical protein
MEHNPKVDNIPHSNSAHIPEDMRETPVETFDTPLHQAVQEGKVSTLSFDEATEPQYDTADNGLNTAPRRRNRTVLTVGGVAAGAALVVGGFFGVKAVTDSSNSSELTAEDPATTGQVDEGSDINTGSTEDENSNTTEGETTKSFEQLVNEKKIESGLSAEAYAETLLGDRIPSWFLGGKGQAYWDEVTTSPVNDTVVEDRIAKEQAAINTNALFIPGWESNPNLKNVAANFEEHNSISLVDWRHAYDFDESLGTPEWEEDLIVEQVTVIEESETGRKLSIAGYEVNNAAETSNPDSPNADHSGTPWKFTITTTIVDGTEYVSDWES